MNKYTPTEIEKELVSVVVPVFNSATSLPELCKQTDSCFDELGISYQLVLVNDGSKDDSWKVIQTLKHNHGYPIVGINKTQNTGQHNTLYTGIFHAQGAYIVTIDDDLQFLPSEISLLIETMNQTKADLVYGSPELRKHSQPRNMASRLALNTFSLLLGTHRSGSPFRLFKAHLFNKNMQPPPIVFIDGLITPHAKKIAAVAVSHKSRAKGISGHKLHIQAIWALTLLYAYSSSKKKLILCPLVILTGAVLVAIGINSFSVFSYTLISLAFLLLFAAYSYCVYTFEKAKRNADNRRFEVKAII